MNKTTVRIQKSKCWND